MKISTKIASVVLITAFSVVLIIMIANYLMLGQMREEAVRQATRQQESSIMTFWELINHKGRNFRIEDGNLLIGDNYVINGNNEIPDKIFSITGSRATVFMGDTRVATNILRTDGSRAIGTKLVGPAHRAIFQEGIGYRGEAQILGIPYFTAYDPIRNDRGEIIGVLFVGVKQSEYLARYDLINMKIRAINGALAAVFVLCATLLILDRKRSENAVQKQLSFQQLLLDTIPSPIFSKDPQGRYNGCNSAMQSYIGFSREEMIGKTVHELWPEELADLYQRMDQELLESSGTQTYESRVVYADGTLHDVIFHKAAFRDHKGVPGGLVGVILDITERKAAEEEKAKLEAQKHHSLMMEALMVQLNHDLRTPLTPLFALIPMIRKEVSDPQTERMLEICQRCVNQIQGLAVKSLDLVRLSSDAAQPEPVPVALAAAAESAFDEAITSLLEQRGVSCINNIDPELYALGAPDQLTLLFNNLLSNAARYAAKNGTIRLDAAIKDDIVEVSVQDDGLGLDPHHLPLVFNEFFKADAARHDLDTQGLGLAICQRIVTNHGGRIWALSPGKDKGSTMFFNMKLAPAASGPVTGKAARSKGDVNHESDLRKPA